jgi:ketosteroid isomerase-like protein
MRMGRALSRRHSPLVCGILLAALALPAGAVEPTAAPATKPGPPPRPLSAVDVVRGYMSAWNEHDAAKAAEFLDERVAYYVASAAKPQTGKATVQKNVIEAFLKMAPDCAWKLDGPLIVNQGGVAFQWVLSGTNTGDWADGTKATGKKFELKGATILRLHDYRILFQGDYYDSYTMLKQVGLAK